MLETQGQTRDETWWIKLHQRPLQLDRMCCQWFSPRNLLSMILSKWLHNILWW